ncbi:MAG TPA: hypothetical protein VNW50_03680 [Streptosporangiaceae bacterium]|nr:hypothetical protein [Streptosporangiaceae bacterium]
MPAPPKNGSPPAHTGFAGPVLAGDVDLVEALGSELLVHFTIDAKRVVAKGAHAADAEAATISGEGMARVDPRTPAKAGERLTSRSTLTASSSSIRAQVRQSGPSRIRC